MLKVAKFKAYKSSNMHNDSVMKVSENTLIPKPLKASKKTSVSVFSVFFKLWFRFFNGYRNSTTDYQPHGEKA